MVALRPLRLRLLRPLRLGQGRGLKRRCGKGAAAGARRWACSWTLGGGRACGPFADGGHGGAVQKPLRRSAAGGWRAPRAASARRAPRPRSPHCWPPWASPPSQCAMSCIARASCVGVSTGHSATYDTAMLHVGITRWASNSRRDTVPFSFCLLGHPLAGFCCLSP